MPRKPRFWSPNAMYHITCRGNRRSDIFLDNEDRLNYLTFLEDTRSRYPFTLHSYCLMTNHIHLLIQTKSDPIHLIMMYLNMKYAKSFNKKYDYVGHLFQGRYGAELIDSEQYKLDVSRYIHRNPLEAGIVQKAEHYLWSSYRAYIHNEPNPHVHTEIILSYFPTPSHYHYQCYVERNDDSL